MHNPTSAGSTLQLQRREHVAVLTLARPDFRNAVSDQMWEEIGDMLQALATDDSIRAVVLTGAGKAFCSGGDISGMRERFALPPEQRSRHAFLRQGRTAEHLESLAALGKPTVAALNGIAAGVGCDLALACDYIVSNSFGGFMFSYVARGLVPDGSAYLLPRRVGLAKSKYLLLAGKRVDGAEALTLGLIDEVVENDELLDRAVAVAAEMSAGPAVSVAMTKSLLNQSYEHAAKESFNLARHAQTICITTQEHQDAVAEFLKR